MRVHQVNSIELDQLSVGQQDPTARYQGQAAVNTQVCNNTVVAPYAALSSREPLLTIYQIHKAAYEPEHHGLYRNHDTSHIGSRVITYSPRLDMGLQSNGPLEYYGENSNIYVAGNLEQTANRNFSWNGHGIDGSML